MDEELGTGLHRELMAGMEKRAASFGMWAMQCPERKEKQGYGMRRFLELSGGKSPLYQQKVQDTGAGRQRPASAPRGALRLEHPAARGLSQL